MDYTVLKKIGLTDKELNVYIALLKNGATSVRGLAEIVELNRGTVYDTLKKLQELGLAGFYHHGSKQKFVAEDPDKLIKLVETQEDKLKHIKNSLDELVPELRSVRGKEGNQPTTKFYDGRAGVRYILEDVLYCLEKTELKEYYVYSAKKGSDDLNGAYPDFTRDRIRKKIAVKVISLAEGGGLNGLDERRWLGTNDESATFILIYANKCAFISHDNLGKPVGVIVENSLIYETQKTIFLQLWKLLK